MRGKVALGSALVALVAVGLAVASPPGGKGKPENKGKATTGVGCKPAVMVVLRGTIAGAPGTGSTLALTATSGNRHARAYIALAQPLAVTIGPGTKIRKQGQKVATALAVGDRVLVQARVCKADLGNAGRPALVARMVVAQGAKGTDDDARKGKDQKQQGEQETDDDD